jgi:hypothetical protein
MMKLKKKLTTGHFMDFEEEFDNSELKDKFGVYHDAARTVTAALAAGFFDGAPDGEPMEVVRELDPLEVRQIAQAINHEYITKYKPPEKGADPN